MKKRFITAVALVALVSMSALAFAAPKGGARPGRRSLRRPDP